MTSPVMNPWPSRDGKDPPLQNGRIKDRLPTFGPWAASYHVPLSVSMLEVAQFDRHRRKLGPAVNHSAEARNWPIHHCLALNPLVP